MCGLDRVARAPGLGPDRQQHLADIRHLFDWLVTRQVVPESPAASIRGPSHVLRSGKTAVLEVIHVKFKRRLFLGPSAFTDIYPLRKWKSGSRLTRPDGNN